MWIVLQVVLECNCDPGFADPRLAGQQYHAPLAGLDLLPAPEQQLELLDPADQRRLTRTQRLKAALNRARPNHLIGLNRSDKSFHFDGAEIMVLEQVGHKPSCPWTDDDRVGGRGRLQARREIRRL